MNSRSILVASHPDLFPQKKEIPHYMSKNCIATILKCTQVSLYVSILNSCQLNSGHVLVQEYSRRQRSFHLAFCSPTFNILMTNNYEIKNFFVGIWAYLIPWANIITVIWGKSLKRERRLKVLESTVESLHLRKYECCILLGGQFLSL